MLLYRHQVGNVARATTPPIAAWLVAAGNASTLPFPLNERLPFVVFGACWCFPLLANFSLSAEDITMNEDSDRSQSKQQGSPLAETRTNEATALLGAGGSEQAAGQ